MSSISFLKEGENYYLEATGIVRAGSLRALAEFALKRCGARLAPKSDVFS